MATIRRRNGRYQAQVRKQHRPPVSRTFKRLSDARRWATSVEYEMEKGAFQHSPAPAFQTIAHLIDHYQTIINPADDPKHTITSRLGTLKQHLGPIHLTQLRGSDLARYRDERLKTIKNLYAGARTFPSPVRLSSGARRMGRGDQKLST